MPAKPPFTQSPPTSSSPSMEEVRDEASALAREMLHDTLRWTRAAWHIANRLGDLAVQSTEGLADRVQQNMNRGRTPPPSR